MNTIDVAVVLYLERIIVVVKEFQALLDIGKSYAALFLVRLLGLGVTTGEVERVALYFGLYLDKRGMLITDTMFESVLNEGDEHQGRDHQVRRLCRQVDRDLYLICIAQAHERNIVADETVRQLILKKCGAKSIADFQLYSKERQKDIVRDVMTELGAGPRQMSRVTGLSYMLIYKTCK